ncbi:MAG: hypothetical protein JWP35_1206 [Caulobacter sp.]|nr:hypothetical protein [Caulobacter sp.]
MRLVDEEAARFLAGPDGLLDGRLTRLCFEETPDGDRIEMTFATLPEPGGATVLVTLTKVRDFDFNVVENRGYYYITHLKCLWTAEGLYLSLDPYDERLPPSDDDAAVFRAARIEIEVQSAS